MLNKLHNLLAWPALAMVTALLLLGEAVAAEEPLANEQLVQGSQSGEYLPPWQQGGGQGDPSYNHNPPDYEPPRQITPRPGDSYTPDRRGYEPPPYDERQPPRDYGDHGDRPGDDYAEDIPEDPDTYSSNEILDAGHRFFGSVSKGLANVVEYAFSREGRPNGYILGEEAGGALFAGVRYGEGTLYTKNAGVHKIYWQGPSLGYDLGADGSKTLILVYNLRDIDDIYRRFAGVDGSAYFVGGVGITFQTNDDVILAPIRSGVGVRFGANIGYLKYTRRPTWNPF